MTEASDHDLLYRMSVRISMNPDRRAVVGFGHDADMMEDFQTRIGPLRRAMTAWRAVGRVESGVHVAARCPGGV